MRNIIKIVIIIFFIAFASNSAEAQLYSAQTTISPSTSTLIGNASCIGYHYNDRTSFYMRYNDASYICCTLNGALILPTPNSTKILMPQDFAISDFKKFRDLQGFIGSYEGVGMYGKIINLDIIASNLIIHTYKMPAVDRLNRIAICFPSYNKTKAFAIGEKAIPSTYSSQSYILEFYAEGESYSTPYRYAPLAYDPVSGKQECVDDVITLNSYVVFATRDTRNEHKPINLRISDTTDVLQNTDIDNQWQLDIKSYKHLSSKLRLIPLDDKHFILAYIINNVSNEKYYLCIHRIFLPDLLSGINSIVSHEIEIEKDFSSDLTDIIYEPDVQTMVLLLNGEGKSEIYHVDPFSNTSDYTWKLFYPNGNFYSLDTIGDYIGYNADRYLAIGGNEIFYQDISNGIVIDSSCLQITKRKSILQDPPRIGILKDPIERYSDSRLYVIFNDTSVLFEGLRTCFLYSPESKFNY